MFNHLLTVPRTVFNSQHVQNLIMRNMSDA